MAGVLGLSGCALSRTASQNADAIAPSTMATNASALNPSPHIRKILAPSGALRVGVYLGSPTSMVRVPGTQESVGVALELGRALGQQLGVPVEITEFARVAAVLDAIKAEKLDMTFTNATPSRAKEIDFTEPLVQLELGLLVPVHTKIQSFADIDQPGIRLGVSQGSSSQAVLGQRLKQATIVPVASLEMAASLLQRNALDAFATNKGILFEMNENMAGFQVLQYRWGLENLAIAIPKGRQDAMPFVNAFAHMVRESGQLDLIVKRAGLRGMTPRLMTE
jgi:polar amino acid transport system substrate-binding protein